MSRREDLGGEIHEYAVIPTRTHGWSHTTSACLASLIPLLLTASCILLSKPSAAFIQLFQKRAFQTEIHFPNHQLGTFLSTSKQTHPRHAQPCLRSPSQAPARPACRPQASPAFCALPSSDLPPGHPAAPRLAFRHWPIPISVCQSGGNGNQGVK